MIYNTFKNDIQHSNEKIFQLQVDKCLQLYETINIDILS